MQCYQCQNMYTSSESISCTKCNSKYHRKCVHGAKRSEMESGDRKYHWVCSSCQMAIKKANTVHVQQAINILTEKVDLINKFQIPKLCNDLSHVKNTMDCLVKQNEDILKQLEQLNLKQAETKKCYQKRNLKLSSKEKQNSRTEGGHLGSGKERHRTRRKSRSLIKLLIRINKKLSKKRSSRTRK